MVVRRTGDIEGSGDGETETWRTLAESGRLITVGIDGAGIGNSVN